MANDVDQRTKLKLCTDCGGYYLLAFFRLSRYPYRPPGVKPGLQHYRDRCIGCDAIRNVEETMDQSLRRKALGTRRRHGAKLKQLGMIKKESDLEEIYDWSLEQMIVDIVHVRDKGCPYCHKPVDIIEQGLGAITLDIFNAELCHTIPLTWFGAALDVTAKNSGLPLKCGVRGSPLASLAAKSGTARR